MRFVVALLVALLSPAFAYAQAPTPESNLQAIEQLRQDLKWILDPPATTVYHRVPNPVFIGPDDGVAEDPLMCEGEAGGPIDCPVQVYIVNRMKHTVEGDCDQGAWADNVWTHPDPTWFGQAYCEITATSLQGAQVYIGMLINVTETVVVDPDPAPTLVAHWPLETDGADVIGGRDCAGPGVPDPVEMALRDPRLDCGDWALPNELTLLVSVKMEQNTVADHRFGSEQTCPQVQCHVIMLSERNGQARGRLCAGGSTVELIGGTLAVGVRHRVGMTYDGSVVSLWLDGILVASTPKTGPMCTDPVAFHWGEAPNGADPLIGWLRDGRLYDAALTQAQLQADAAAS